MRNTRIQSVLTLFFVLALVLGGSSISLGATFGNVDGSTDEEVDLKDAILSLQVCTGVTQQGVYVYKNYEISGDDQVGAEEAVYALRVSAGLESQKTIWYKDADGDGYSDGTTQVAVTRPSSIYYDESEVFTSGDEDDNNPNIHPNASSQWVPFDASEPADASESLEVDVPVSNTQEVVIEYSIPGMGSSEAPAEGQIYNVLDIHGAGYMSEPGKPRLPVVRRYVAVPEGASVQAQVTDSTFREIGDFYVYPAQQALPDIDDVPPPPFEADADIYSTNAYYPSERVELEGPVIIRGVSMMIVEIHPVQFNPVQRRVRSYSSMTVKVTMSGGARSLGRSRRLRTPAFDTILSRLAINNDFLRSDRQARAAYESGNSLLIITHPNFLNAANTLRDWKIKKGIETEVRTTSQTGSSASAIQSYIKNAYQNWNPPPTYVLLIGDAEFIPTHYRTEHPLFNHSQYPQGRTGTDLYYATVDGSDYFPDISIGRLSVDTAAQADKRMTDIINYEKAVVTDGDFYSKAAICGYFQHAGGGYAERRFAQTSEDLAIYFSSASYLNQYTVDRIYCTDSSVSPSHWSNNWFIFGGGPAGDSGDSIPSYAPFA